MIPRNVRNSNPGNIDAGDHWQGLMDPANLTEAQKDERFAVFESPKWGFRAMVVLLRNYRKLYGCDTVLKIVNRFAPPVENNTHAYADQVARALGVRSDQVIDVTKRTTMFTLCKAMTRVETGSWEPYWDDGQLNDGLTLAGFPSPTAEV